MFDHKYTEPSTKGSSSDQKFKGIPFLGYIQMYSRGFELFDLALDVPLVWDSGNKPEIHGLCIPMDSFDLRCESVTIHNYGIM